MISVVYKCSGYKCYKNQKFPGISFSLLQRRGLQPSHEFERLKLRGSCCVSVMTDMTSKLKVELGIWETGDWLTQPQASDNCISLPQQTQRRQGVEWEDNGKGHQSITGCFAIVVISVSCHSHYPCPLAANHTVSNSLIWGDSVDYRLEGNHSGILFFIIHGVIIL